MFSKKGLQSMYFKDLVGQEKVVEKLIGGVKSGRISHAQLFSGAPGSGNLIAAVAYCRYIACENPGESDACGTCRNCKNFDRNAFADLHFSYPIQLSKGQRTSDDLLPLWKEWMPKNGFGTLAEWMAAIGGEGKQGVIATDESISIVRKLLLKSYEGGYKFLILWLPEHLNISAANKMLKLIEEPPEKSLFVLVSNNPGQVLPTIFSRTQQVNFLPIPESAIATELERRGVDAQKAKDIAFLSEGNFGAALNQLKVEEGGEQTAFEIFRNWMRLCFTKSVSELVIWSDTLDKAGREMQKNVLEFGLKVFREALWVSYAGKEVQKETEQGVFLFKFAPYINERNALELVSEMEKALSHVSRNASGKILFLDVTFKIIILLKK